MQARRVAMISCGQAGPFTNVGDAWAQQHFCGVEGVALAIGADMWCGSELTDQVIEGLKRYEVLVVDLHGCFGPLVERLAKVHPFVAVHQEGSGAFWNWMTDGGRGKAGVLGGLRRSKVVFVHQPSLVELYRHLTPVPVYSLGFVYPFEAERYRRPHGDRDDSIFVGSGVLDSRGGLLSAAIARDAAPEWRILSLIGHHGQEMDPASGEAIRATFRVEGLPLMGYEDFLDQLARCRAAIHLDPHWSLGRFAADCAAVGVPCVGYRETAFQGVLFPRHSCRFGEEEFAYDALARLVRNPVAREQAIAMADQRKEVFGADVIGKRFWDGLAGARRYWRERS